MRLIDRRIGLLFTGFVVLLGIAAVRSAYFGAIKADRLQQVAATQHLTQTSVPAPRGTISDRHGVELAVSEPADDVAVDPHLLNDPDLAARRLAPVLGENVAAVRAVLSHHDRGFAYVARDVPAGRAARAQKLGIPGLQLIPQSRRVYPRGELAGQLIGGVGVDGAGLSGLEYGLDGALRGHSGERRVVRAAQAAGGQPISVSDVREAQPGQGVRLTIDAPLQAKVEQVLRGVANQYHPKDATAVVMDPRTGALLAVANWPSFDPDHVARASAFARQDRAVGYTYEPGSTFKVVAVAGALQDGLVTPSTSFVLPPSIRVADRTIHDDEPRGTEQLSVAKILAYSSNVGAITIGMKLGAQRFDHWVRRFGFGRPTGIDIPGEERGIVLHPRQYSGSSMGNLPIGQGESVTPIQIATAYAAIANGGVLRPPHVVARVGGHATPEPRGHRVISRRVAAQVRTMLKGVLRPGGTAPEAAIPGYSLAGKTGTANKVDPRTGTYSTSRYVASFIGFVPADHPRLLVAVMVDEPHGAIYGGAVAAPAFQKIVAFAVPYLGLPPR